MRLGRGVANLGDALRATRPPAGRLRAGDRRLVEIHRRAGQAVRRLEHVVGAAFCSCAHRLERLEVGRNRAPRRKVAAGRRDVRATGPREQRTEQQHRPAQAADQRAIGRVRADSRRHGSAASSCRCPRPRRRRRAAAAPSPPRRRCAARWSARTRRRSAGRRRAAAARRSCCLRRRRGLRSRWPPSMSSVDIQISRACRAETPHQDRSRSKPDEDRLRPQADAERRRPALDPRAPAAARPRAVAPPRLTSASGCFDGDAHRAVGVASREPARSISHAAGIFTCPRHRETRRALAGNRCRLARGRASVTTGFMKNEPTLRVSGSPASMTMPLRRRMVSTALRTSATVGLAIPARLEVRGRCPDTWLWAGPGRSRNVTSHTTNRPRPRP